MNPRDFAFEERREQADEAARDLIDLIGRHGQDTEHVTADDLAVLTAIRDKLREQIRQYRRVIEPER